MEQLLAGESGVIGVPEGDQRDVSASGLFAIKEHANETDEVPEAEKQNGYDDREACRQDCTSIAIESHGPFVPILMGHLEGRREEIGRVLGRGVDVGHFELIQIATSLSVPAVDVMQEHIP